MLDHFANCPEIGTKLKSVLNYWTASNLWELNTIHHLLLWKDNMLDLKRQLETWGAFHRSAKICKRYKTTAYVYICVQKIVHKIWTVSNSETGAMQTEMVVQYL